MYFYCETDIRPLDYRVGEKMRFTLTLREGGATVFPDAVVRYRIEADGKAGYREGEASAESPLTLYAGCDMPGFVRITAKLYTKSGEPCGECGEFNGGAGAGIDRIFPATPLPSDYAGYRETILQKIKSVKPELIEKVELPSEKAGFRLFDVKISCAGNAPVSGYLTVPDGCGKLRCKVGYKGYGVKYPLPEYEDGTAYLFTNAHGFENGREQSYYDELSLGKLANYGMSVEENARPETSYFYDMIVRAVTAAEFMTTLDVWNGKDLILYGGSQGGMQALNAASLCEKCTFCDVFVPWMCDTAAKAKGRMRYASPEYARGLAYFDGTNAARYIKCETRIDAGLGDYVCQPSGVIAMYNELKCRKTITFTQNMIHGSKEPDGISESLVG
ncbi:MAG: acetylxylan esterase [Clostridia bacterium]|nr:acetylxylan esterase [Clostridia bacterium]